MNDEQDKKHNEIASWLDCDTKDKNKDVEIKATQDESLTDGQKPKPKEKKRTGRKRGSTYEDFRGDDGKIDYNLAYRRKKGIVENSTLSKEEKKQIVLEKGTKILFVQCPVCYGVRPLVVKLDKDGNPLKKHENGIKFKEVDGVLQRRFSGPDDDYLPLTAKFTYGRYGQYVNIEESAAINTLKRVDHELFNDFKKVLEKSLFKFQ